MHLVRLHPLNLLGQVPERMQAIKSTQAKFVCIFNIQQTNANKPN